MTETIEKFKPLFLTIASAFVAEWQMFAGALSFTASFLYCMYKWIKEIKNKKK